MTNDWGKEIERAEYTHRPEHEHETDWRNYREADGRPQPGEVMDSSDVLKTTGTGTSNRPLPGALSPVQKHAGHGSGWLLRGQPRGNNPRGHEDEGGADPGFNRPATCVGQAENFPQPRKSVRETVHPNTLNSHPNTLNNHPGTLNSHPNTLNNHPDTLNSHPNTLNNLPAVTVTRTAFTDKNHKFFTNVETSSEQKHALSVVVKYFAKDVDLGRLYLNHDRNVNVVNISEAKVEFKKQVDLEEQSLLPSPSGVLCPGQDKDEARHDKGKQGSGFKRGSFPKMIITDVSESVTAVKLAKYEERGVESSLHIRDTRRFRNVVIVGVVLTAVDFADTVIIYGKTSARKRHVSTTIFQPKRRHVRFVDTLFVFPQTTTRYFVSSLTYHIDRCRKWFKTRVGMSGKNLPNELNIQDFPTSAMLMTASSASCVTSEGADDVRDDVLWVSEVLIPVRNVECGKLSEVLFRLPLPKRKLDEHPPRRCVQ
ncbi:hypothetical protein ACOMHN_064538 [Nucella lapillus]